MMSSLKEFLTISSILETVVKHIAHELNKYLRTFPYLSLKSDGFQSSPEFSYIFYVKH